MAELNDLDKSPTSSTSNLNEEDKQAAVSPATESKNLEDEPERLNKGLFVLFVRVGLEVLVLPS